jgi:hypothetical protein
MRGLAYRSLMLIAVAVACSAAGPESAGAEPFAPGRAARGLPFTATLSNIVPLAFGMDVEDAARALGTPLNYIGGRRGNEIFLALRNTGGSGLFRNRHRLYLQFRKGRLTGWKGDWRRDWIWQ